MKINIYKDIKNNKFYFNISGFNLLLFVFYAKTEAELLTILITIKSTLTFAIKVLISLMKR